MQSGIELRNLILAFAISTAIMFVWQLTMPEPPAPEATVAEQEAPSASGIATPQVMAEATQQPLDRQQAISASPRLPLHHPHLKGSISLKGGRIDDLTLTDYKRKLDPESKDVTLLAPSGTERGYFAEFGWSSPNAGITLPDSNTQWTADQAELAPGKPVTLMWENGQGLRFETEITVDEHYMFTLTRRVINSSGAAISLAPYGLINHHWHRPERDQSLIMHEGPFGAFNDTLEEVGFTDLEDDPVRRSYTSTGGWAGIGEKYWFTALIPPGGKSYEAHFSYNNKPDNPRFQTDYLGETRQVAAGSSLEQTEHFFAGPKIVSLLDAYSTQYNLPLLDRAVDFGLLYFLTKPFYKALKFFHGHLGNFGLAIMALTVCIRLILFPLANKSFVAIAKMRELQPKMTELRERYADDKMRLNQEVMALYQREKVNPMAGCLPIIVQIPIFFALYKVLYVSIEMRHAPFYGWIHDLSAPDPTSALTLFGLIPVDLPTMLTIGVWPIIMCLTMVIQQKLAPEPTDPVQAKVMKLLPFIFLFLFASFPAGLVIYWAWNNTLSVLQQYLILKRHGDKSASPSKQANAET